MATRHMTARPALIMPALRFASQADTGRALSLMPPIISEIVRMCQTAQVTPPSHPPDGAHCSVRDTGTPWNMLPIST